MALSYDYTAKFVGVPQADAQPLLVQGLINSIRAQEASAQGITYDQIADASGKADLGGSVFTGITVALRSSWKLNFAAGAYQATVSGGNLADSLARVNNTGNPQVLISSSAAATLVEGGGTGGGATAAQVWTYGDRTLTGIAQANIKQVNDITIDGAGTEGDPWGPV
jgi:hypothetical protein